MPSPEASRRNLAKAQARWRQPRPWRCETETQLIRHVTLRGCNDIDRKWSGRKLARILGVSQMYVWKLTQQFEDGNLNVRSPLGSASSLEELGKALGSARRQTREMREQGLLRETTRQMIDRVLGHPEISR
jgi:biotin operon repressor